MTKRLVWGGLMVGICDLLGGCAYLTNYTQPINLRDGSVAIDVKQRVVFSQGRSEYDEKGQKIRSSVVVCAEPSPDALTVLGASGGLSINNGAAKVSNATLAFAESGSSIGLRTQSIQLLRDAMYRLCEGYAAGAVSNSDFAAMQRRYQSTMMGLIAIEQLTGPIVAAQSLLTSSAAAQSGASAGDAAVDSAQSRFDLATEATLRTQTDVETSQTTLDATRSDVKVTGQKLAAEKAKKEPDSAAVESLGERMTSLAAQEKAQHGDLADKKRRLAEAQLKREEVRTELASAKAKVASSAAGTGRFGDVAGATRDSNVAFAEAVRKIVTEINSSYSRDGCLTLLTELARTGSIHRAAAPSSDHAEIEKVQQRVVELRGTVVGQEELLRDLDAKSAVTSAAQWAAAREKYERARAELKFAEDKLTKAQQAAASAESAAKVVGKTTDQAVAVCQSILAADEDKLDDAKKAKK